MKKRFSKLTSLFLVAGLSLAMVTGCGTDSKDDKDDKDDKKTEDSKEADSEVLSAEEVAEEFSKSSVTDIKLNGTSFKVLVDFSAKAGEEDMNLNLKFQADVRTNPMVVKAAGTFAGTGMDDMDIESYVFVDEEGKTYVEVKNEDGSYIKSELDSEQAQQVIQALPTDDVLITADQVTALAEQLKGFESVGKKTVDGTEYDTLETKVAEATITSVLQSMLPALVQSYGEQYGITEETAQQYLAMIPEGYGEIPVDVYFDKDGLPAGISVDLSSVVKAAASDDNAKAVVALMVSYNNTDEIAVPEATDAELNSLLG